MNFEYYKFINMLIFYLFFSSQSTIYPLFSKPRSKENLKRKRKEPTISIQTPPFILSKLNFLSKFKKDKAQPKSQDVQSDTRKR